MSAHVKRVKVKKSDKMRGMSSISLLFRNKFNEFALNVKMNVDCVARH